jgi:F-type H+-transporting ATPase subunit epsilon
MAAFKLNLFTPNGVIIKGLECDDLVIPTCRGEINVLPNHTHILTELSTGVLTTKSSSGTRHFSVTAGFCKVLAGEVNVLSYTSETPDQIDIERAKSAKAKAESRLQGQDSLSDVQMIKFRRKLERSLMRIRLANLK